MRTFQKWRPCEWRTQLLCCVYEFADTHTYFPTPLFQGLSHATNPINPSRYLNCILKMNSQHDIFERDLKNGFFLTKPVRYKSDVHLFGSLAIIEEQPKEQIFQNQCTQYFLKVLLVLVNAVSKTQMLFNNR